MSNKQLTFKIDGRDAVPVRAIPYVTSWGVFHPNVVTSNLARSIRTLRAYRIPFNTPIQTKLKEWLTLKKLTKELCLQYENNTIDVAAWEREFVALLPADAFVWLDDLENLWKRKFRDFINDTRPVNPRLTLTPTLDADEMAMVIMDDVVYKNIGQCLDGYWEKPWNELPEKQRRAWHEALGLIGGNDEMDGEQWGWVDKKRTARYHDCYHDPAFESERLVFRYDDSMAAKTWLDMENVKPKEAAMLLCRLNPHNNQDPERIFVDGDDTSPDRYRLLLRVFEDKASVSPEFRTLMQWRSIARERGLQYHPWIDEYVQAAGLGDDATATMDAMAVDGSGSPKVRAKKQYMNENRAFFLDCKSKGVDMNIESIWLYISQNAGKEGFLFTGASQNTATKVDGKTVKKDKLGRALSNYLKSTKNKIDTKLIQI